MNDDDKRHRWISLVLPAATFLVGLVLGGTLVYANTGGDNSDSAAPGRRRNNQLCASDAATPSSLCRRPAMRPLPR